MLKFFMLTIARIQLMFNRLRLTREKLDFEKIADSFPCDDVTIHYIGEDRTYAVQVVNMWDEVHWYIMYMDDNLVRLSYQNCLSDILSIINHAGFQAIPWHYGSDNLRADQGLPVYS